MEVAGSQHLYRSMIGRRIPVVVLGFSVLFLNGLGLLVLLSIGRAHETGMGGFFLRQCLWLAIAVTAFGAALAWDTDRTRRLAVLLGGFSILLLVLVLIPGIGVKVNGARRWIDLGPMNMQVSDVAKIGYIFLLARYFAIVQRKRERFVEGFLLPLGLIAVFSGLIFRQPDFGTAFLFGLVGGLMLFLAGVSLRYLIPTGFAGLALFAFMVVRDPVRMERILAFLDVEGHRSAGAYQLWQGLVGFAMGGWRGVGLGNGRQQFAFLPEAHTDFIFPIIGEEMGLVATMSVLGAFGVFFLLVWHQLQKAPTLYSFLLVAGALFFITFQAMINIGVATGCLPTKGMSLPFISYGGSNLVVSYVLFGIICRNLWCWNKPPSIRAREISDD